MPKDQFDELLNEFACASTDIRDLIREARTDLAEYLLAKYRFQAALGRELENLRLRAELTRTEHCKQSGLSRGTCVEIETTQFTQGDAQRSRDGSSLDTVCRYLSPFQGELTLSFSSIADPNRKPAELRVFWHTDPAYFSASLVKALRKTAGLSQGELLGRLAWLEQGMDGTIDVMEGKKSPWISRIENAHLTKGIRVGTMFAIAFVCGYRLSLINFNRRMH